RGGVVEFEEFVSPVGAELVAEHLVHGRGGQRWRRLLESGQRLPVRPGQLFGQGRLEDGERLAHLHRAALELAEDGEELLGGALLNLRGDHLGGHPGDPFAETEDGPTSEAERQRGELGGPGDGSARDIAHPIIVTDYVPAWRLAAVLLP